jgi:hypothetical protein
MHDLGEAEGTSFITMEYVSGEDLRSNPGPPEVEDAKQTLAFLK